ncbi:MAG: ATP-binding protein [Atribacterota bacterium]|nr:ATP-binding protein [Atribacterota bacterium]MDD4896402.1 ATP-binding protein [Atribacterota bacterium]MDD5637363.1 ATP-binding protein [Atribacterota bacterium]
MKEIVIISGKGGTGKTVLAASIAALAKNKVMGDCDVDASNLYLLLHPEVTEKHDFYAGLIPAIDLSKCNQCGLCQELCRFEAIKISQEQTVIDFVSCEGCGLCALVCPQQAIQMNENHCGEWYLSETKYGLLIYARLGIAEENSGKLVALVRQNAQEVAKKKNLELIIIDGPPGIGCPLIASISGANLAIVVTEPTLSGIHDLERVIKVTQHFGVKVVVIINKYDLNLENSSRIEEFCAQNSISVGGKIHFDNVITEALVKGLPVVEYSDNKVTKEIRNIWRKVF